MGISSQGRPEEESDQPERVSVTPLLAPLQALQNLLSAFNNQGVIIGGIAASLLGAPRYTVDLDAVFLLGIVDIPRLLQMASAEGIEPRIPNAEAFARQNRVVLLRHKASDVNIDLSLGILPFEVEMVQRSISVHIGDLNLRLPTPEDLIILKAVAHRPKDLEDIRSIAEIHTELDLKRIQFWVEQFGEALDAPDLWKLVSPLLHTDTDRS